MYKKTFSQKFDSFLDVTADCVFATAAIIHAWVPTPVDVYRAIRSNGSPKKSKVVMYLDATGKTPARFEHEEQMINYASDMENLRRKNEANKVEA